MCPSLDAVLQAGPFGDCSCWCHSWLGPCPSCTFINSNIKNRWHLLPLVHRNEIRYYPLFFVMNGFNCIRGLRICSTAIPYRAGQGKQTLLSSLPSDSLTGGILHWGIGLALGQCTSKGLSIPSAARDDRTAREYQDSRVLLWRTKLK